MDPITFRAEKGKPCPVCGAESKGCSATSDDLHFCRGDARNGWKQIGGPDDSGFGHYRREEERPPKRSKSKGKPKSAKPSDEAKGSQPTPEQLQALADTLRVPVDALDALPIGWDGQAWTFDEWDANGSRIGVARRFPNGRKVMVKGSRRGLTLPTDWRNKPGPVLILEGASDAIAGTYAGLCCIGRPSNCGGSKLLAELLSDWPTDRGIIVVGERDEKDNGTWPGRDGAASVARNLTAALGSRVPFVLPPSGVKDVRDWLTSEACDESPWHARGAKLLAYLQTNCEHPERAPHADAPEIVIGKDEFRVNAQACQALGREHDIYQRGGVLTHVVVQHEEPEAVAVVRRPVGSVSVRELAKPLLRERLTRCASWVKIVQRDSDECRVPAHPPGWAIDAVYARADWPSVPRLEAVVPHPVLLADGTILDRSGYHSASGLLVCLPPGLTVNVPDRPSRADVAAAVADLMDVIHDFPFETPGHRSAWFASLLTPLAWFAFTGPAPLFLIDGNVRGVGKGLLADVVALIVTGRPFPRMSYTNDREELRKKITTLAVEGERLVLLDNLAGAVGNDVLDMALTSDTWKDRLLGGNRIYNGPLNVMWVGTGNNVQFEADTARRVLQTRLETADERPEMKEGFRYPDLRAHILSIRGKLLAAALTILRGWIVAGRPTHKLPPWGSFEQWSNVVREAVVFAGLPDPGETRMQLQTMADRDANAMIDIIAGVAEMDEAGRGMTTAEIVKRLKDDESPSETMADMRAAVEELCGKLCGRILGYKFRHFKRRNFNGRWIDKASSAQGKNRWAVVSASAGREREDAHHRTHPNREQPPDGCDGCDGGDVSDREKSAKLFDDTDVSAIWK